MMSIIDSTISRSLNGLRHIVIRLRKVEKKKTLLEDLTI